MLASLVITVLFAQPQSGGAPSLHRVDEGVSDRDPLSVSMRSQQVDMRQPLGFSGVYQVEGRDLFVRRSGAIWAVFPRGLYTSRDGKAVVMPPAGMVYSIGTPYALREQAADVDPVRAGAFDLSADAALSSGVGSTARLDRRIDHALQPPGASVVGPGQPSADEPPGGRPPSGSTHSSRGGPSDASLNRPPRFVLDETYRRTRLSRWLATATNGDVGSLDAAPSAAQSGRTEVAGSAAGGPTTAVAPPNHRP